MTLPGVTSFPMAGQTYVTNPRSSSNDDARRAYRPLLFSGNQPLSLGGTVVLAALHYGASADRAEALGNVGAIVESIAIGRALAPRSGGALPLRGPGFTTDIRSLAAKKPVIAGPAEAYNRAAHYGRTPTAADRAAVGAGPGQVANHSPPLVQRYYEGDPAIGEIPGWQMTPAERATSAADRTRMSSQPRAESDIQGGQMSAYSRAMKRKYGW